MAGWGCCVAAAWSGATGAPQTGQKRASSTSGVPHERQNMAGSFRFIPSTMKVNPKMQPLLRNKAKREPNHHKGAQFTGAFVLVRTLVLYVHMFYSRGACIGLKLQLGYSCRM